MSSSRMAACWFGVGASLAACTTLGPTPATTGWSAVPAARPDVEAQLAMVPGHYLSSAVVKEPKGAAIGQLAVAYEPDRTLGVPGVVVGARLFGPEEDTLLEPVIGYRRSLGDGRVAIGGFAFGTRAEARRDRASYEAWRGGVELATDLRVSPPNRWAEAHLFGGAAITALSVDGTYCVDEDGTYGVQCPDDGTGVMRSSHASGVFPALHVGVAAALFRHREGWFHGARVAAMIAGGAMPRVIGGEESDAAGYFAIGLAGSVAIGGR